jgi:hypothetical protein
MVAEDQMGPYFGLEDSSLYYLYASRYVYIREFFNKKVLKNQD